MLDLEANLFPVYNITQNFYGHDFVWCMIHNFGEKTGMFGNLTDIAIQSHAASTRAPGGFQGVGLAMEGINQNPVVYELATETAQSVGPQDDVAVHAWVQQYVASRYGPGDSPLAQSAWSSTIDSSAGGVYTSWYDTSFVGIINGPGPDAAKWGMPGVALPSVAPPGHNATNEALTARLLLHAAKAAAGALPDTLRYDLVDATRQWLDNLLHDILNLVRGAYSRNCSASVASIAHAWMQAAANLNTVLSTDENFMLGPWIVNARATASASGADEMDLLEFNARYQITLWVDNYARKMWGGLVSTFYAPGRHWMQLQALTEAARTGTPCNGTRLGQQIAAFEGAWQKNFSQKFPITGTGDAVEVITSVMAVYDNVERLASAYERLGNTALVKIHRPLLSRPNWNRSPGTMAFLCDLDDTCRGFTSDGWLLSDIAPTTQAHNATCLYIKKTNRSRIPGTRS